MSRSLSWIDPNAVQQALSRAHQAPGSRAPVTPQMPPPPPASLPPGLPEPGPSDLTVEMELGTEDLYPPDPAAEASSSSDPRRHGSLAERLRSFAVWVEAEIGPTRWFLADEQGMGLHAAGVGEADMVASAMLARALRPLRGFFDTDRVESVTLELAGGRKLYTVWCDTGLGRVALGLQDPRRLTPANVDKLRAWLRDALHV